MKTILFFLAALMCYVSAYSGPADSNAKPPKRIKRYHVNYFVTGGIIGVGMVSDIFAISRLKGKPNLTNEELAFVTSDQQTSLMTSIDRWALKQNPADRDVWTKISDYTQTGTFLLPALLIIDKNMRRDWYDLLLMYVEGHTITFTFYNYSPLGPTFQNKNRPITYYPEFDTAVRASGHNRNSFYSGHVASSAYSTFFMAKVYCDYHPNMGAAKYLLYLAAAVPPLFVGYARVKALAHFPSDDLVGFALGAIIGIVIPELHKNRHFKNFSLSLFEGNDATGLSLRWKFANQGTP
jgi:membrane-associated phospholipid phosphatase